MSHNNFGRQKVEPTKYTLSTSIWCEGWPVWGYVCIESAHSSAGPRKKLLNVVSYAVISNVTTTMKYILCSQILCLH